MIKFSDINFSYTKEKEQVIKNFSLVVREGDSIVIEGASGSGKTTLFRLLLGFEIPDSGKIYYNSKELDSDQIKQLRNDTFWLPQDLDLGEGLLKDVFYHPFSFKANNSKIPEEKKVLSVIKKLGLPENIWKEKFANLSTGQRQRVGIALCYLLKKKILLLDEPTSALDKDSKEKVANFLLEDSRIILSTSHDPWWVNRCKTSIQLKNSDDGSNRPYMGATPYWIHHPYYSGHHFMEI